MRHARRGRQLGRRLASLWERARERLAAARDRVALAVARARSEGFRLPAAPSWARGPEFAAPTAIEPAPAAARGVDLLLLGCALALLGLGMVVVYSASAVFAQQSFGSSTHFLRRHLVYAAVGLAAMYLGWRLDYRIYQRLTYPMLLGVLALLGALLVPGLGTRIDGATRWFHMGGLSFQPSEVAKFALVVYLARSLSRKQGAVRTFSIGFLPHLAVAGLMSALVLRQPDLGTAAVLGTVTLLMLFVAGTKLSYIVISLLAAAPVVYQAIVGTPWRMRRLLAFLDPWSHRQDAGYQISESLISVGSGGLYGLGLGDGKQKLFFLPAAHTDFIFAIVGEELGFVGIAAVVALFLVLIWRGLRASFAARDLFGAYLAFGIAAMYGLQALLHISVVLGLLPTKGITLPLMSYGGTALVTALFSIGVLLNVAARNPEPVSVEGGERRAGAGNRRRAARVVVAQRDEPARASAES
jgi:cell division protein FtsW